MMAFFGRFVSFAALEQLLTTGGKGSTPVLRRDLGGNGRPPGQHQPIDFTNRR
jgi:hypothetical protein